MVKHPTSDSGYAPGRTVCPQPASLSESTSLQGCYDWPNHSTQNHPSYLGNKLLQTQMGRKGVMCGWQGAGAVTHWHGRGHCDCETVNRWLWFFTKGFFPLLETKGNWLALEHFKGWKAEAASSYWNVLEMSSPTNRPCAVWRRCRPALGQHSFLYTYSQHLSDSPRYSVGLKLVYKPKTTLVSIIYV